MASKPSLFVKRDLDGFFGLFVDNLVQLIVITEMTVALCGLTREFVYSRILPGAAISILIGNIFYSAQAYFIARREGRDDVTALPYGINTPSVFAYILFIMAPVFAMNKEKLGPEAAANLAWQAGLAACLGSGLIEFFGAFVAERIRRATPRAALISALAGIAIGFISMDFVLQVFEHPLLAMIPMGIILMQYFSGVRLPLSLPAGLAALLVGTLLGWTIKGITVSPLFDHFAPVIQEQLRIEVSSMPTKEKFFDAFKLGLHLPVPSYMELKEFLTGNLALIAPFLPVIIPMGLFNLVGSLQNIESAEAAGDKFPTAPSLMANGIGTMTACALGSCFPTTIYIGHVGWKQLGARSGYSWLNGIVISALCLFGVLQAISVIVPVESVIGILLWIAIIITAQAFQSVPRRHAPAVALGIIPGIAAWGLLMFKNGWMSAGKLSDAMDLKSLLPQSHAGGLIALDRGFILTSMCLSALGVMIIDRRFKAAAVWAWILAGLSLTGIIHSWNPLALGEPYSNGFFMGWRYALAYAGIGGILYALRGAAAAPGVAHTPDDPFEEDAEVSDEVKVDAPASHIGADDVDFVEFQPHAGDPSDTQT
ncbi:NCS2 family permease [Candidatus Sumerlaeota bacterium]|nr:NCS2 family permease [Candidatus Sumerlaeota bacterium]